MFSRRDTSSLRRAGSTSTPDSTPARGAAPASRRSAPARRGDSAFGLIACSLSTERQIARHFDTREFRIRTCRDHGSPAVDARARSTAPRRRPYAPRLPSGQRLNRKIRASANMVRGGQVLLALGAHLLGRGVAVRMTRRRNGSAKQSLRSQTSSSGRNYEGPVPNSCRSWRVC